jgi:hypothetical protein
MPRLKIISWLPCLHHLGLGILFICDPIVKGFLDDEALESNRMCVVELGGGSN